MRINLSVLESDLLLELLRDEKRRAIKGDEDAYLPPVALLNVFDDLVVKLGGIPE